MLVYQRVTQNKGIHPCDTGFAVLSSRDFSNQTSGSSTLFGAPLLEVFKNHPITRCRPSFINLKLRVYMGPPRDLRVAMRHY